MASLTQNSKKTISLATTDDFYRLCENLYLVKTPSVRTRATGESCIEDFFPASVLSEKVDGKVFNPAKTIDPSKEYGKAIFADKVVRPKARTIDFSGFVPLLDRIVAVIDSYGS